MEKIYEESGYNQKQRKVTFPVILSFVVALFAIGSLIAVGFNQISYAATPIDSDDITLHIGKLSDNSLDVLQIVAVSEADVHISGDLMSSLMFADSNDANTATTPLFCIEKGADITSEPTSDYVSEGEIRDDFGLIYILNQSRSLGGPGITPTDLTYPGTSTPLSAVHSRWLEQYATQVAIWLYLYDKYPEDDRRHGYWKNDAEGNQYGVITSKVRVSYNNRLGQSGDLFYGELYSLYLQPVVAAAKNQTNVKTIQSVLSSQNISKVGDGDIYQTDKITVVANPSSDLVNYSVELSGLEGAYVVDKDGNTKTSLDTFAPDDYFYIRVPVNKVTDASHTVNVKIIGQFQNYLGGNYFGVAPSGTGDQRVVGITSTNFRIDNTNQINFMVSPDTGMTTAQTIYFIGLIVLLCGVGIIYANAKPIDEK